MTVTCEGKVIGTCALMDAHAGRGQLHLAVSVQLLDRHGRWILQKRGVSKPLFASRWSNSCCTHPQPNEVPMDVAVRRSVEELGAAVEDLRPAGTFVYRARDPASGLVEYEFDLDFVGQITGDVVPNDDEVADVAIVDRDQARTMLSSARAAPWSLQVLELAVALL